MGCQQNGTKAAAARRKSKSKSKRKLNFIKIKLKFVESFELSRVCCSAFKENAHKISKLKSAL